MKSNKTLVLGTVLTAAGIGACVGGSHDAHADSVYTVQKGDTVYKISRKFVGNTSLVKDIVKANNLSNPNLILVGQKLNIPTEGSQNVANNTQKTTPVVTKTVASTPKAYTAKTTAVKSTYTAPKTTQTYVAPKATKTYVAPKIQTVATKQATQTYVAPKKQTYVAPKATQTYTKPATQKTYVAPKATNTYVAPKTQTVAKQTVKKSTYTAPVHNSSEASAKAWIANKESTNNYNARNGRYIGKYQLDASYLNGDYSAANQERVAERYVKQRYGSWAKAQAFHQANGWY